MSGALDGGAGEYNRPMRWLVDGYNVIRCDPGLAAHEGESLEAGRDALCRLLAAAARTSGDQFTIVFDGQAGGGSASAGGGVALDLLAGGMSEAQPIQVMRMSTLENCSRVRICHRLNSVISTSTLVDRR